ncbi:MFS transporter [Halioxenophilus aromaticivorans]|uniref:MFS transporter n=1 Tax=Halioxenophilus aromaticivorans TaxID=1306992 RepID=A0AAV3U4P3_9ALTE
MIPMISQVGALLVGVSIFILGVGLLNTILALRANLEGYSDFIIGLIMSCYFVGFFIGTYVALPLVKRMGHIRAFAACASVASACVLLHQLVVDPFVWMGIRVLTGIALVILYTVIESWLNGQTPAEHRGKVFAVYMSVNLGSLALAQQLLRLDPTITFTLFALSSVLLSLSLVPITWTRMQQPQINNVSKIELKQLWRKAPVAVTAAFVSGISMGAFWGLAPSYAVHTGMSNTQVASFITCAVLGGAACQIPLGRLSDKQDRRLVMMLICIFASLFAGALIAVGSNGYGPFALIAAFGGMAFAVYPVAMAHMVDHLEPGDMLAGGSGMLLLHGIGAMLGPTVAGQLMQFLQPSYLPGFWAAAHLLLALTAGWILYTNRKEDPEEHAADFVPMVRTTPTALEMLPGEEQGELFEGQVPVWGHEPEADTEAEAGNDADADDNPPKAAAQ